MALNYHQNFLKADGTRCHATSVSASESCTVQYWWSWCWRFEVPPGLATVHRWNLGRLTKTGHGTTAHPVRWPPQAPSTVRPLSSVVKRLVTSAATEGPSVPDRAGGDVVMGAFHCVEMGTPSRFVWSERLRHFVVSMAKDVQPRHLSRSKAIRLPLRSRAGKMSSIQTPRPLEHCKGSAGGTKTHTLGTALRPIGRFNVPKGAAQRYQAEACVSADVR